MKQSCQFKLFVLPARYIFSMATAEKRKRSGEPNIWDHFIKTWPEIRDIEPIICQRLTALKLKMAATKRLSIRVDYVQLNNLSSVVLYDNSAPRKKKGKTFDVERIIGRKKEKHVSIKVKQAKF